MDIEKINKIVWWIPFKNLRNDIRNILLEINELKNHLNRNISYTEKNINDLSSEINNLKNSIKKDLYNDQRKIENYLRKITPRPYLDFIEFHLAEHCNLGCYSCVQFSQIAEEEYYDIEEFERDVKRLFELTNGLIGRIHLMGGEPLLNKNCKDYFFIVRKYFKFNTVLLVTNGILLPKQEKSFWESCRENNITISPTKYPLEIDWDKIQKICNEYNIKLNFYDGSGERNKVSNKNVLKLEGDLDPFHNFIRCWLSNKCVALYKGKICNCSLVPYIKHFNKAFNQNLEVTEMDTIDIYKAKTYEEILEFIAKPIPFCRYCNVDKWRSTGKWQRSEKSINEYVD